MPKRRTIVLLLTAVALLAGVLLFVLSRPREPSYKGIPLSTWLLRYDEPRTGRWMANPTEINSVLYPIRVPIVTSQAEAAHIEARRALQQIGTNAVPYLIKELQYEYPPWALALLDRAHRIGFDSSWVQHFFDARAQSANTACSGFSALGPQACSAVPDLVTMLCDRKNPETADRAAQALYHIGWPAVDPLLNELTNGDPTIRPAITMILGMMGTNAAGATPFILRNIEAQDENLTIRSIDALAKVSTQPALAIAALTNVIHHPFAHIRMQAAYYLGKLGPQARSSGAALQKMLNDPDEDCRATARIALAQIAPELLTNPPPAKSP